MQLPDKEALLRRAQEHRGHWANSVKPARIAKPGPGEESVWDYPRPPAVEDVAQRLRVVFAGETVADTTRGRRVIETAGAPVYYFPPEDVRLEFLRSGERVSVCEWKGVAIHYDLVAGDRVVPAGAFAYPDPFDDLGRGFDRIAGWIGFYPTKVDACFVGEEQVTPQPGGFYAGWVTGNIVGPIKGEPGTEGW
jgi:uncharacterized protein (DUF427 family)